MTIEEEIKKIENRIKRDKRKINQLLIKKDLRDNKIMGQLEIKL